MKEVGINEKELDGGVARSGFRERAKSARVGTALDREIRDLQDNCFNIDHEKEEMQSRIQ